MTTRRWRVVLCAPVLLAVTLSAAGTSALLSAPGANAATGPTNTITLVSQTPWVRNTTGMHLDVAVQSPTPEADLELEVTLYSQATERGYFEQSLTGDTAGGFAALVGDSAVLPLDTKGLMQPTGNASIALPLAATPGVPGKTQKAPTNGELLSFPCTFQCPGVYPLQVSLENLNSGAVLDSFMTYLILAPSAAADPLRFSWILPIGSTPATSPDGTPSVPAADEQEAEQLDAALASTPSAAVSLALYPQFTSALAAAAATKPVTTHPSARQVRQDKADTQARHALTDTGQLLALPNVEAESETFTPVDLPGLSSTSELADQFTAAASAFAALGVKPATGQYVSAAPLSNQDVSLLKAEGIKRIVVPSNGVGPVPQTWVYPVWAPFVVKSSGVVADASDYYLEQHLQSSSDPVLRANQLLADLALLYFVEQPPGNRGVTLLAPLGWHPSSQFLTTVLTGLASSPMVQSDTLSQFFASVPPGSDETPSGDAESPLLFRDMSVPAISQADKLPTSAITAARTKLVALSGLLPKAPGRINQLRELVLLSETAQLAPSARSAYLGAPSHELNAAASQISLPDDRTITITSLSAKIPVSIYSKAVTPLKVDLVLSSSNLSFRHRVYAFLIEPGNNAIEIPVTARTAGDFPLSVTATTMSGGFALASGSLTIRSTAISDVAVALTAGAGAFLLLWWTRSAVKRKRSGKHARAGKRPNILFKRGAAPTTSAT